MARLSDAPLITIILGFGGLIPFAAGVIGLGLGPSFPFYVQVGAGLPIYAAVILSFLAGGRWASELTLNGDAPRSGVLILAISLCLAGWIAVMLQVWNAGRLPVNLELVGWGVLIFAFVIQYLWDRAAIRDNTFPDWYLPLRSMLTLGAVLSLSLIAFISWSPTFSL